MTEPRSPQDPKSLLKALIACPSVTPETGGVLDLVEGALGEIGFAVTRLRFDGGGGSYPVDNLFASRGRGGRKLLFAGHTDVVPPGEASLWSGDPFSPREAGGRLYGRGAADMKSGLAAFIAAAAAIPPEAGTVMLAITNDEEAEAVNGTARLLDWMAEQGHGFDFALVGEPSSAARLGDSIKIGRRGSLSGRITVTGRQGHVAYPEKAINPLPLLARIVVALETPIDAGTTHFPPSHLEVTSIDVGNAATNVIPAAGRIAFNIRYNELWTPETLGDWVRDRIASIDRDAGIDRSAGIDRDPGSGPGAAQVEFEPVGRPARAFLVTPGEDVERLAAAIEAVTGRRPALSTGGGTSDARFIARHGPVVECGLVGASMHQADEYVELADLAGLTQIYRAFMTRFFGGAA